MGYEKKTRITRKIELDSNAISSDNCLRTAVILWSVWYPIEQKEDRRFCLSLFIRLFVRCRRWWGSENGPKQSSNIRKYLDRRRREQSYYIVIGRRKATVVKCLRHLARQIFEKIIIYTTIFCFFRRRRLRITVTADLSAAPAASYKFIQGIIIVSPFTLFRAAASRSEGLSFSTGGGGLRA